jgi:hypothetical protein
MSPVLLGVVREYDRDRGLGVVGEMHELGAESEAGGEHEGEGEHGGEGEHERGGGHEVGGEHPFHCTAIADGSREIDPGTTVAFVLVPGHGGRFEASTVTKLASQPAS